MIDRKSSNQRQCNLDKRSSCPARNRECNRNEEYEAHFEESRQTNDQADAHHGPWNPFFAEDANQRQCNSVGAARLGHHFAQHSAERNHDCDVSERVAHPDLEGMDYVGHRHSRSDCERERCKKKAEKRIQLQNRDEKNDSNNGAKCAEQEEDTVRIDHRRAIVVEGIICIIGATPLRRAGESGLRVFPSVPEQCTTACR